MKITLIRAPVTLSRFSSSAPAVPPIGLAYIASAIKEQNHEISVIDGIGEAIDFYCEYEVDTLYRGLSLDEILERAKPSDVFGLSIMFSQDWPLANELLTKLHQKYPTAIFVAGGEHVTAEPVGALEDCAALDVVVSGEGEATIVELLACLEGNKSLEAVGGICYRTHTGEIVQNLSRPRTRNLEKFPWPAWDLFPMENYLADGHGWGVNRGRSMPIIASRGCPYQCTFCSNPNMWTTRWVVRSVHEVIDEIRFYVDKYQATNFDFQDLTAIVKKAWIKEFCQELINAKIKITWQLPTGTRTEAIDNEVAHLLYESGCKNITYAPESGSLEVLKRIKKKIDLNDMIKSARQCIKAGLDVKFNFIFGFPEDTYTNLLQSMIFMVKLAYIGASDISVAPFSPYPGSELFRQLQEKGKIPRKIDDNFYKQIPFADMLSSTSWCEKISSKNLNRMQNLALIIFYFVSYIFHPSRPFKRLYNLVYGIEETRMDKALGDMKRRRKLLKSGQSSLDPRSIQPF